jgi:hypothetical protein
MNAPTLISPVIPAHPQLTYGDWFTGFPLRSFLELGAYESAPGSARGHARNVLAEWGLGHFEESVTLVISELVTNALRATQQAAWDGGLPPVRLWLLGGAGPDATGQVLLLVWDGVAEIPALPRQSPALAESGRGMRIARKYSTRLDFYHPRWSHGGKIALALIDKPAPPDDDEPAAFCPGDPWPDD